MEIIWLNYVVAKLAENRFLTSAINNLAKLSKYRKICLFNLSDSQKPSWLPMKKMGFFQN